MNEAQRSEESTLTDLLAMPWYLLGQPWCYSDVSGTLIQAGSDDPHRAIPICGTDDVVGDYYDIETARGLAEHIVKLHNNHKKLIELIQAAKPVNWNEDDDWVALLKFIEAC